VRDIATVFKNEPRVTSYMIECENFESIHNHSAYACISSETSITNEDKSPKSHEVKSMSPCVSSENG
jgi:hypothetical protein